MVTPKKWLERYDRSKKAQAPFKEDYVRFRKSYMGDNSQKRGRILEEKMAVNFIYSMVEVMGPSIFAGDPNVNVHPKHPQWATSAKAMGENINYWAKELDSAEEFRCAMFDWFFGWAVIEVGWEFKTKLVDVPDDSDPSGGVSVLQDGTPGLRTVQKEYTVKDRPFLRYRNPFDIFLDVDLPRKKDGRFMIVRDIETYETFMSRSEIPQEMRDKVKPTMRPEDSDADDQSYTNLSKGPEMASDREWVEVLTIWDKEAEQKIIMTPSIRNEFLAVLPWPYDMCFQDDPFPITILEGKKDFMTPYTFSSIRPLWDHIQERNRLRSAFLIHMKRALPKYVYNKGAGTRAQVSKFMNARSDEATEMNDPTKLMLGPVVEMPQELYKWDEIIKDDLQNLSGLWEFQNDSIANTATEASIMEGRGAVRKKSQATIFEQFVATCLGKLGMICQQLQDEQVAVEIESGQGDNSWMHLSRHDIAGEFRYEIEPGIMEYKNEALRKQQILKFAELMANNPNVDQRKLSVKLAEIFDFASDEILLTPEQIEANKPPAEPTVKFKPIDLQQTPIMDQLAIITAALKQNGIDLPQMQGPLPGQPPVNQQMPQTNMDHPQGSPMGGMVPLPPVAGNAEVQPMSMTGANG